MQDAMLEIGLDTRLVVNPNMVLRQEDDGAAMLYDPDSGAVRIINGSAVATWKLLDGQRTVAQVLQALHDMYNGMDAKADEQVLALLRTLYSRGAVGTVSEPKP